MSAQVVKVCKHCHQLFVADRRSAWHQFYCGKPEYRKASKAASQKKWLAKNPDYYRSATIGAAAIGAVPTYPCAVQLLKLC